MHCSYDCMLNSPPKNHHAFGTLSAEILSALDAALRHVHGCKLVRPSSLIHCFVIAHSNEAWEAQCNAAIRVRN
ncbi:hypothetical protein DUNSADRAFT_17575 [Dunaliella salina]|uniref:Encoded protein n=1 Tax=Dunaliella salina TaxID=3046 RepID=A0ABQ7G1I4_DUNSA|nr:hypothetical protein DUNSADRAFT_17575 [Dunaliella salina]|eukprot:KAF5828467.1 hypothetical protein DUNSADRAFT_17575 [Dunaliella salina]